SLDSLARALGLLEFPQAHWPYGLPLWMILLWLVFCLALPVIFIWLSGRWRLAALLGALGGVTTYLAAEALGAVVLPHRLPGIAWLAVEWGLMFPLGLRWLDVSRDLAPGLQGAKRRSSSCRR
ncbi:MAG: DUF2878 family protein, partial [Planctomycetes bacterium]|nr:DUF2878 family protein [Planctomycetota bacterium]